MIGVGTGISGRDSGAISSGMGFGMGIFEDGDVDI
jgi:hypothetical protein